MLSISSEEIRNSFDIQSKAVPVNNQGVALTGFRCSKVKQPSKCSLVSTHLSGKTRLMKMLFHLTYVRHVLGILQP